MQKSLIKVGDLVTVNLGQYNQSSNTYRVEAKLKKKKYLLSSPIAPECYIIKDESEFNTVVANLKSPIEKCLLYAQSNRNYLGYIMQADLDALGYYFVVKKDFSPRQKEKIAAMCAKIASIKMNQNLQSAAYLVKTNYALLDEFNKTLFNNLDKIINDVSLADNDFKRISVYKLAGYVLAQLEIS